MTPILGLVCQTTTQEVRYRTITRTRLFALDEDERHAKLRGLYRENAERLLRAIEYCRERDIRFYRLPTGLLPFSDDPRFAHVLREDSVMELLCLAGRRARDSSIRIVTHPDQFVVLNSERREVVENAISVLVAEAAILDALGLPATPSAAITVHGGKGGRAAALVREIRSLPENVRARLVVENDERSYGSNEILDIAIHAGVPMLFDAHHALVKERLPSYDDARISAATAAARSTWPPGTEQVVHISNGRDSLHDLRHSEYIERMPAAFRNVPYIEVEAKAKELALFALRDWFPQRLQAGKRGRSKREL